MNKIIGSEITPPEKNDPLAEAVKSALSSHPNLISVKPSMWLTGNGAPKDDQGAIHDFYLDSLLGNYFVKTKNGWEKQGSLKGFKGDQGDRGIRGETGPRGEAGQRGFRGADGRNGIDGRNGKDGKDGKDGEDGREIELRKSKTHIQWHYVGDSNWKNLVSLEEIRGPAGQSIFGGGGGGIAPNGVPIGGTTNQVLAKKSASDYDLKWISGGGGGGSGVVETIVAGSNIDVDDTDPANPVIAVESLTAADVTDFDAEVSNNTDVAANSAARHAALTVTDSSEIDLALTGQDLTASLKAGSVDETKLDASVNASLDLADSSVQPGDNVSDLTNDAGYTTNAGTVDTANSPNANEFARFTDADTIEGRTVVETKTDLALNNVDNTSDANKPVSTAQATADNLRVLKAGDSMSGLLKLDFGSANGSMRIGADVGANTFTAGARKIGRIVGPNYTDAGTGTNGFVLGYDASSTYTAIDFGGTGAGSPYAATLIRFYTESTIETAGGQLAMQINEYQHLLFNTTTDGGTTAGSRLQYSAGQSATTPILQNGPSIANTNSTVGNMSGISFPQAFTAASSTIFGAAIMAVHANRTGGSRVTDLAFYTMTANTIGERMRILGGGNVGIGTSASITTKLTVSSAGANGVDIAADTGDGTQSGRLFFSNATGGQAISMRNLSGSLYFGSGATAGTATGSTQAVLGTTGLDVTNHMAVGTGASINANNIIRADEVFTDDTSATTTAFTTNMGYNGTSNTTGNYRGVSAFPYNAGSGSITNLTGINAQLAHNGASASGTIVNARAFQASTPASVGGATGTFTNTYGMDINNQGGAAVSSSAYGINLVPPTNAAVNNIGLRLNGTPSGGSGINVALQLDSTAGTAAGGILFGTDTTLYRSAANTLKTNDSLIVDGSIGAGGVTPTAILHLKAGTATANTAPLKFTSGTNLTTAETGAMEYNGTSLFFTPTGTTRRTVYLLPATPQTYTASNVSTDRSYDADATSIDELADILGTLIADLRSEGVIA